MVFYDGTGIRKQYVWALCALILVLASLFIMLAYAGLSAASSPLLIPYNSERAADPTLKKTIALTFDDGPDPVHTPAMLAYLKSENVPAAFFLIGENVVQYPDVARQIVAEGFEIGNHTFTHSEHVNASPDRLHHELVATDRVIRDVTGTRAVMFRPPFLEDVDVGEFDGSKIDGDEVRWAEDAGYVVVGANLDTQDWNVNEGESEIVLQRLYERMNPEKPTVVIMHEHAGNGATLEALKTFIPDMKAQGYRFVPVSEYFGLAQSDVMPPAPDSTPLDSFLVSAARTYVLGTSSFNILIMFVSVIGIARMWAIVALRKTYVPLLARRGKIYNDREPLSIIIPAFNEAANIEATIRSVFVRLQSRDEVLVIDDGSTDSTALIVRALQNELGKRLVLLQKENGGTKGLALSFALPYAKHRIVACIDADTIIERDAFDYLAGHFRDPSVGAVAGKIYPAHLKSLLSIFQYLEYMQGQNLDKEVYAVGNAVGVVPGALGAWRKSAVMTSGGYSPDTVVEDQDLTLALLSNGWKVRYEPQAKAYTETPDTLGAFFKQRSRWVYGTLQCVWKYRTWLFSPKRPSLGWIVLPNVLFFNLLIPVLVPFIDIAVIMGLFGWLNVWMVLGPFIIFTVFDIWCAIEGVAYERQSLLRLIPLVVWQRFFYRYIMAFAIIKSIATALAGNLVRWGLQQRRGECHVAFEHMRTSSGLTPSPIMNVTAPSLPTPTSS